MRKKQTEQNSHISVRLDITRQKGPKASSYIQSILFESSNPSESVASALRKINESGNFKDMNGQPVETIRWEHSCLQKRCGACAMVIDGKPALACGTLLRDHKGKGPVTIAPLSKFPVICDLLVDRSILFDNLKTFGMWEDAKAALTEKKSLTAYDASRCLQCGCCLEVCPNFAPGEKFFGAAGFVPASRLLSCLPKEDRKRIQEEYLKHEYSGCGKSLACMNICPAQIDIESLLVHSAQAVLFHV